VGIMMWTGLAGGGVLAQVTHPPVSPPGGSLYGPRMTPPASSGQQEGPSNPCAQATRLLTRQMEWHRRIDEGIRKIHDAVRQMDETVLEGLEEEIAEMERAHRELEDASESCRSYVARLQLLTPCDQIPYLEEALSGAQALLSATVDLSIKQSMVLPGLMNVQMMPGVGGYPWSLPWGTGGGFTWTPAGVTPVVPWGLNQAGTSPKPCSGCSRRGPNVRPFSSAFPDVFLRSLPCFRPSLSGNREIKNTAGDDLAVFLLLSQTRRRPATVRILG